ncbi:MAG: HlyD family type I secretion periplasmic adaptor subunit [Pseudomonadales bacterium]|nr:HlyD family type I secretion periplasmic adaptor subunit [Pseudomonadales bacterium]
MVSDNKELQVIDNPAEEKPDSLPAQLDVSLESPRRIGLIIFFLVFGVFGIWAAIAPIEGAAHAPGVVTVKSNKKVVQHLEGGIVSAILAKNGDLVSAGTPLLILDNTQSLAQLEIANSQFVALKAIESRLIAERDGLEAVDYPQSITNGDVDASEEISAQNRIFEARRKALSGSVDVLEQRIEQLNSQIRGMRVQRETREELMHSFAEELADVRELLGQGFSDKNRLRELERNIASLRGEAAELLASISTAEIQIGEARLQILQQNNEMQNEVVTQLGEVQTQLKDVNERMTALRHIVNRTVITAPADGVVNGLQYHTVGGVIAPGTPIAEIVPQAEELVIEAQVSPNDIDRIALGQEASIRFSSFSSTVPTIYGRVINISADSFTDQNSGASYYMTRVEVPPEGLQELGSLELVPGMPAEVFIATGARTFLQYLLKPLSNGIARSFIED